MPYAGLPEDADVSAISNGGYVGLPADAITTPLSRKEQLAKGAPMSNGEASDYMAQRAAFAKEGGVKMFAKAPPTETRKISYTDTGYKPNKPAKSLKEFAKNAVQDVVELPMFPVRMAADIANAPDTVEAVKETAKGLVTTPLGFVPGIAEFATGRTAAENWATNPGIGALTALGAGELARVGVPKISEFAKTPNLGKLNAKLDTEFTKAVRPSVANTRTGTQAAEFADKAKTAVKEIVLNKDNLGLVNEFGEPVQGLPKNLHEFRQAIDSTKKNLWRKVEDINTAAGEKGAAVPLDSAANELRALADNPVYQTMEPNTISYAQQRADALAKQGSFTVDEAQNAVTLANQSLKSFYQNPTADAASRAYVDSLIANHLRSNLDAALEQATGTPAAHGLRQAYGSLKTIERDVNQRATVDARKNQRGLADFSDIFTAGELVNALASFNPAGVAKAGAMGAVKGLIKHLNDPNTHVRRLFKTADKLVSGVDIPMPEAPKPYSVPTVSRAQSILDAEALPKVSNDTLGEVITNGYAPEYGWEGKPPAAPEVANPEALPPRQIATNFGDELRPNDYAPVHGWEGKAPEQVIANPEALPPRQSSQMPQLSEQGGRVVPHVEAMTPRVPEGFNPEVIGMGTEDVQLGDRLAPKPRPLRNISESLENTDAQNRPVAGLSESVDTQVSPETAETTPPAAHTWKSYLSTHMSRAMKETGGDHGKAMKLLGEEWRKDKNKDPLGIRASIVNKLKDERGMVGVDINKAQAYRDALKANKKREALRILHEAAEIKDIDAGIDRGGAHSPSGPTSGAPLYDLSKNGIYPEDVYSMNGRRYYGSGYDKMDNEAYRLIQRFEAHPNAPVTIYRAVYKEEKGVINPGDWVTIVRDYAKDHGESALNGDYKIIKKTVYARDIFTSGDSWLEWGYHPQGFKPEIPKGEAKTAPLERLVESYKQRGTK